MALAAWLVLAGCSGVDPDYNPIEWGTSAARAVGGWFDSAPPDPRRQTRVEPPPAEGRPYPNLGSVPRPPAPRPAQVTDRERAALVADRDAANAASGRLDRGDAASIASVPAAPPPPAEIAVSPLPAAPLTGGPSVSFLAASVPFAEGRTTLDGTALELVRDAAGRVPAGGTVRVVGHASRGIGPSGPAREAANLDVSRRRAETVAAALQAAGVPPAKIVVEAAGDTQPNYDERVPGGAAGHRRVEIFIDY